MSQPSGDESADPSTRLRRPVSPEPVTSPAQRAWSLVREVAGILVASILVSLFVKTLLVQAFFVPSGSMEPTLHGCEGCFNDRVLVNKQTSLLGGIHRGDVVVFHDSAGWLPPAPTSESQGGVHNVLVFIGLAPSSAESNLVKRVIGVGGDTVEGRGGNVYLNGTRLTEPYVFPGNPPSDITFKVTVPAGMLWVMGDHRSESADSRYHQEDPGRGFVPVSQVVGRAFVIVWPLNRAGTLNRPATFDQPVGSATR